ncbi:ABC transporter substrate-binding protein [Paeniglutamicibacter sp. MACA_103]|uniref:ABC transporter substrate-binding protein n=1 Tax=Paeniglutamicibacter sp. MACA_103 TaxID=3377337 RepID=UPI0038953370
MTKRLNSAIVLAIAGLLALTGCSTIAVKAADIPDAPARGGILQYGTDIQPVAGGIDPYTSQAFSGMNFWVQIYEPLLTRDDRGNIQPGLAAKWEQLDATTYRFHLRENAKFSNGAPLRAEDVEYSLETMAASGNLQARLLTEFESATVIDDHTVDAHLSGPSGTFLGVVSDAGTGSIVNKDWYSSASKEQRQRTAMGTGPFQLTGWQDNVVLELRRNEHYWDPTLPHLDGIDFRIFPDEQSRLAALRQGSVDAIWLGDEQLAEQVQGEGFEIGHNAATRSLNLFIDSTGGPTADTRIRQAISKAMDREKIALLASYGYGKIGGIVPVGDPAAIAHPEDLPNYAHDPEGARALLEKADAVGTKVTITYPSDASFSRDVALYEVMKEQLRAVGIELVLNPLPWADTLSKYISGNFKGIIAIPGVARADASAYFSGFLAPNAPANTTGAHGKKATALWQKLNTTVAPAKRKEVLQQLENEVADQVLNLVPYVVTQRQELWSPRLQGYVPDPYSFRINLKKGWLVP